MSWHTAVSMRLLALHAHPDDEASKGAGTVARYVDAGATAVLVTATGGEAGDILNPAMDLPEVIADLPAVRRSELQKAADIIGYSEVITLDYRDSGMPDTEHNAHPEAFVNADSEEVLERLVAIVRSRRPHVILSYDSHERYPHPDHLAVHRYGMDLFAAAADASRFPEAGPIWSVSKMYAPIFSMRRAFALDEAMVAAGVESPYSTWLQDADPSADDGKLITSIDVSSTMRRGRDALLAHRTQIDPDGPWFSVPDAVVLASYPYEDFELLASRLPFRADESDLFAGIDLA